MSFTEWLIYWLYTLDISHQEEAHARPYMETGISEPDVAGVIRRVVKKEVCFLAVNLLSQNVHV